MTFSGAARRCAMVFAVVTATASMSAAQELASSFDQLRVLLRPGDTVTVTDSAGQQTKGTIAALSSSTLELVVAGNRRSFLESDVSTIRQRRGDLLKNGAWWGCGFGATMALLALGEAEDEIGGAWLAALALAEGESLPAPALA